MRGCGGSRTGRVGATDSSGGAPVIGGGVSVLRAIFDLFGIEQMLPAQGALRHGAL